MSSKTKYRVIIASATVFLLVVGVAIGLVVSMKNDNDSYMVKEEPIIDDEVNIYQTVSTKTYDIELIYIDYYKLCDESIETKDIVYGTTLDKLKEEESKKQKEKNLEYTIEEEGNERLVYKRVINSNCPNHFNVKLEEGKVVLIAYSEYLVFHLQLNCYNLGELMLKIILLCYYYRSYLI